MSNNYGWDNGGMNQGIKAEQPKVIRGAWVSVKDMKILNDNIDKLIYDRVYGTLEKNPPKVVSIVKSNPILRKFVWE